MSIIQTFIKNIYNECYYNTTHIGICVAIVIVCIFMYMTIRMILKYLKERQRQEEELELKILANKEITEGNASIENTLHEIYKILNEIRSKVETRH